MSNLTVFLYFLPLFIILGVLIFLRMLIKHQTRWKWKDERKLLLIKSNARDIPRYIPVNATEYDKFIELLCVNCKYLLSYDSPPDAWVLCRGKRTPKWDGGGVEATCSEFISTQTF